MMDPFRDDMQMGDEDVRAEVRCAKCKELVKPGEEHKCEEKSDENSDKEKTEEK
jgi:hypothetical protein